MIEQIIFMLIIAGVFGFICLSLVLYCCIHASQFSDRDKLDNEQEESLKHIRKEELW